MNSKDTLDYCLDKFEYDYCILGTGLTDSLYSACLSKICKKRNVVIDLDTVYSSSYRTVNFKEYVAFQQ